MLTLAQKPQLWDQNPQRTMFAGTGHARVNDIWIRGNPDIPDAEHFAKMIDDHHPVFYPAYRELPTLRPIIFFLMARLEASELGGILITRVPAGQRILPHSDSGWHPEHYETKCYVPLQTNDRCRYRCADEWCVMRTGDVWVFDNRKEHEVVNEGAEDRMTLIVCLRRDG
ncbi:MAG TPA: aspartyl/asparaginyl beta-hydroxylase domain-containing protein [Burkholderiaceae bacterium]